VYFSNVNLQIYLDFWLLQLVHLIYVEWLRGGMSLVSLVTYFVSHLYSVLFRSLPIHPTTTQFHGIWILVFELGTF